jgi:hypothetical protein
MLTASLTAPSWLYSEVKAVGVEKGYLDSIQGIMDELKKPQSERNEEGIQNTLLFLISEIKDDTKEEIFQEMWDKERFEASICAEKYTVSKEKVEAIISSPATPVKLSTPIDTLIVLIAATKTENQKLFEAILEGEYEKEFFEKLLKKYTFHDICVAFQPEEMLKDWFYVFEKKGRAEINFRYAFTKVMFSEREDGWKLALSDSWPVEDDLYE